jgi:hypothetical protein
MTELLLSLVCIVPTAGLLLASYSRRGVRVNHVSLFSAGFLLYWVFPMVLGRAQVLADSPALRFWYAYFDAAAGARDFSVFLLCALLIYTSFLGGSWIGARIRLGATATSRDVLAFAPSLLALMLPLAVGVAGAYAWQLRDQLFAGYTHFNEAPGSVRGPLSASTLVLLALLLLNRAGGSGMNAGRRRGDASFALAYAGAAVLLLSAGGRLYVASAVLIVLAYKSTYEGPIRFRTALALVALGLVGAGAVGIVRSGGRPTPLGLAANIFAEPLFTSFSMLDFVRQGNLPLWNAPRFLLGDLVNLVPGALLPGKASLLVQPEDYGYTAYAPVGALSVFFSLMINFGVAGSTVAVGVLGFALSLVGRFRAPLFHVVYAMLSGWLAFTFFRDPFSISLVKNMLQFSILVPVGLAAALHVVTVAARQRHPARTEAVSPGGA